MKTGSFVNLMASKDIPRIPKVGDGCTVLMWSDRAAGTIVSVENGGKLIWIKGDKSIRVDSNGMSDAQVYRYEPHHEATPEAYTLRRDGKYYREGEKKRGALPLLIGTRMTYHDYSF